MKQVAVLLAPGFEEGEAIVTIDILRRLHIGVELVSFAASRSGVSYHDIPSAVDCTPAGRLATPYGDGCHAGGLSRLQARGSQCLFRARAVFSCRSDRR